MTKTLIIAEKNSVAQNICSYLTEKHKVKMQKESGYYIVGDYIVTYLAGHVYSLAPPPHYDEIYKDWSNIDVLPILPEKWIQLPSESKKGIINVVSNLLNEAKKNNYIIVNAGDAAREGQLLVDEVLVEQKVDPFADNVKRLWLNGSSFKAMDDAFTNILQNSEKKNLYQSAVCRQRADWVHGMSYTQFFTEMARRSGVNSLVSVGRVQTVVLKIIYDRCKEIENFKPVTHYLPRATSSHENGDFTAKFVIPKDFEGTDSENRLVDQKVANRVMEITKEKNFGNISSYSDQIKTTAPKATFNLGTLQTYCSSKFSMTAQQTLEVAQLLYDNKILTYPRTDSHYLPLNMYDDVSNSVSKLLELEEFSDLKDKVILDRKTKVWKPNGAKEVEEHYGIIPDEVDISKIRKLDGLHKKVFDIVARSLIIQFMPDKKYRSISATVDVDSNKEFNVSKFEFKGTGTSIIDPGWEAVYGKEAAGEDDETIPEMKKGDNVTVKSVDAKQDKTKPPALLTDGTLITLMSNVHTIVTDPAIKKKLKENEGLGTSATRASFIETLLSPKRQYIKRPKPKSVQLVVTEKGRSIVEALPNDLMDPGMTALWETALKEIAEGKQSAKKFLEIHKNNISKKMDKLKSELAQGGFKIKGDRIEKMEGDGETCPECGKGTLVTRKIKKGKMAGKLLLVCNLAKKDDPDSCKYVKFPDMPKKEVKPIEGDGKKCPKCGEGTMVTREGKSGVKFLACNRYDPKDASKTCGHVEWQEKKIEPISGDGDKCTECGKGTMKTKEVFKGPNKGKKFLGCSNYPECKNTVFPDNFSNSKNSTKGGKSKGKGMFSK